MKLGKDFFNHDVLRVAPDLLGKIIVRKFADGSVKKFTITELEAYRGEKDQACHASRGRTKRNKVMYWEGGYVYVYLFYGIHFMLNFVTAEINNPQAILIRGIDNIIGPGRILKVLQIEKRLNQTNVFSSHELWVGESNITPKYKCVVRVGIDYASDT